MSNTTDELQARLLISYMEELNALNKRFSALQIEVAVVRSLKEEIDILKESKMDKPITLIRVADKTKTLLIVAISSSLTVWITKYSAKILAAIKGIFQ